MLADRDIREKVEVLDGSRGAGRSVLERQAVRLADLAPLLTLPAMRATEIAGEAPTAEEYQALLDDVRAIHGRLEALNAVLQGKLR